MIGDANIKHCTVAYSSMQNLIFFEILETFVFVNHNCF